MKKITSMISVLLILMASAVFTSCELDDDTKNLLAPDDTWCTFRTADNEGINNDDGKMTYYFKYKESTDTFSIAIFPAEGSGTATTVNAVVGGKKGYVLREYVGENGSGFASEDESESKLAFDMTRNKWMAIYQLKLKKASLPSNSQAVSLEAANETLTSIKERFTLSNLLRSFLYIE